MSESYFDQQKVEEQSVWNKEDAIRNRGSGSGNIYEVTNTIMIVGVGLFNVLIYKYKHHD